ncbi:HAD family hydrolase [Gloeomargarita lithophora Alchichica-D10]|uniref:HAD family hydrolase n=1 Tax=Gloeomargarita lithophora Alchichica-D10 TaxID=1188229 RepID=A0A1J0AB30_9CYAN|nr:HAD-IA family hydrolase [Gloeomargarita lithophora]APB33117.1 HAD family hydrolase [Gloeomargarita lithophora Alchichica-D10]
MARPGAIFVDAVGTLFGVRGSVGQIYSECAQRVGASVPPEALQKAFVHCFATAPPPAFPGLASQEIPEAEYEYWYRITQQTFTQAGGLAQIGDFAAFFPQVFATFATADPWELYPDVLPVLQDWQAQGIPVGVISNFDGRLYKVLDALGLSPWMQTVTISSRVGTAKPQGGIFQAAWQAQGQPAPPIWHIGDSWRADVLGARAMGWRGIHLCRDGGDLATDQVQTLTDLLAWA